MRSYIVAVFLFCIGSISHAKNVTIITGDQYPPFSDMELANGGVATDLVTHIINNMTDVEDVNVMFLPWEQGYEDTRKAKYLGTFPYTKTREREQDFVFSDAMFPLEWVVFTNKISNYTIEDLNGKTACLPLGYSAQPIQSFLDRGEVTLKRAPQTINCFLKLQANMVDFIPFNKWTGIHFINATKQVNMDNFTILSTTLSSGQLHFIVSKLHPNAQQYINEFNTQLTHIKNSGEYEKILRQHNVTELLINPDI